MTGAPLPENDASHGALRRKLASLRLAPVDGASTSRVASEVSGRTYAFAENEEGWESITATFDGSGGCDLAIVNRSGAPVLRIEGLNWTESISRLGIGAMPSPLQGRTSGEYPCALSGGWTDPQTYAVKICGVESPYTSTLTLRFAADGTMTLDRRANVAFSPTELPTLSGSAAGL